MQIPWRRNKKLIVIVDSLMPVSWVLTGRRTFPWTCSLRHTETHTHPDCKTSFYSYVFQLCQLPLHLDLTHTSRECSPHGLRYCLRRPAQHLIQLRETGGRCEGKVKQVLPIYLMLSHFHSELSLFEQSVLFCHLYTHTHTHTNTTLQSTTLFTMFS